MLCQIPEKDNAMNSTLSKMVAAYGNNNIDRRNVIKEILQELILAALSKSDFFSKAAFNGGTALRIFHGLDRFSEDLDFSLIKPDPDFHLSDYLTGIHKFLASYGINAELKEKSRSGTVKAAIMSGNTRELVLVFYLDEKSSGSYQSNETIRIKIEVDTIPPEECHYEMKYGYTPLPYSIRLYDLPTLFAGKLHAVLARGWKNRIKGRDFYDYIFYLSNGIGVNIRNLESRLAASGTIGKDTTLDLPELRNMLEKRFSEIDFEDAKRDAIGFIDRKDVLDAWSEDFFRTITEQLRIHDYENQSF